jgi:hypothetical protein
MGVMDLGLINGINGINGIAGTNVPSMPFVIDDDEKRPMHGHLMPERA